MAKTVGLPERLSQEVVAKAFEFGKSAYDLTQNISTAGLFSVTLPVADPDNTNAYLDVACSALLAMKVNHYWYTLSEGREPDAEAFELYENIIEDFRA